MRTVTTRAKTPAGIARAYLAQYGYPMPTEWSAGGGSPKKNFTVIQEGEGYRLVATSLYGGRPAGAIFGPRFIVVSR